VCGKEAYPLTGCIECPAGKYTDATGSDELADCIDCVVGTYVDVAGSDALLDCIDCIVGKYVDVAGSDQASDCIDCVMGKYVDVPGSVALSDCIDCVAGRYVDVTGSDASSDCIGCAVDTYVETAGSTAQASCITCPLGKFIDETGSDEESDCNFCLAGTYLDESCTTGSDIGGCTISDCIDCPAGMYVDVRGSEQLSDCIDCVAGRYIDVAGSAELTDCIGCVVGKYVDVTGSDEADDCLDCIAGRYADAIGSFYCIRCVPGYYGIAVQSDDVADCLRCSVGKYVDVAGSDTAAVCKDCPSGRYADTAGSDCSGVGSPSAVFAAGSNSFGQLGQASLKTVQNYWDSVTDRISPVEVTSLGFDNANVFAGKEHTVYLKTDGRVYAAGRNADSQLGDGTTTDRHTPVELTSLGSDNQAVAAGEKVTVFLKSDGRIFIAGHLDNWAATTTPSEVVALGSDNAAVSMGKSHSLFLKNSGHVFAAGSNSGGQLGDGGVCGSCSSPVEVLSLGSDNAAVSAGGGHSVYLKSDGRVFAAGTNIRAQLGVLIDGYAPGISGGGHWGGASWGEWVRADGSSSQQSIPVETLMGSDNAAVSAGGQHTVYLKTDGRVFAVGSNRYGALGVGTLRDTKTGGGASDGVAYPLEVPSMGSDNVGVVAGNYITLFVKADGGVFATGASQSGHFGLGVTHYIQSTPIELPVRARPGRLSARSVSHSKSVLYGGCV
jgi:alpha-tubulin suppressor-like RCC1 family protein